MFSVCNILKISTLIQISTLKLDKARAFNLSLIESCGHVVSSAALTVSSFTSARCSKNPQPTAVVESTFTQILYFSTILRFVLEILFLKTR